MGVSRVDYNGETLIDLTGDSVAPETLAEGVTAHAANGDPIIGTMTAVQYGKAQALTDAQKAQARQNIGSASVDDLENALTDAKESGEFDGPQGPPGLNWRGEWVESFGYQKNDAVSRIGTSYVLVDSSFPSGEKPEEHPNSWAVLAKKGDPGASGVYLGSTEPTDPSVNVWIDPDGDPSGYEEWVFTLADGSTVTKRVVVLS